MSDDHPPPGYIRATTPISAPALPPIRAKRLAEEIAAHGGLDRAIEALAHDQAFAALEDALAHRARLAEATRPQAVVDRLLRQASDLDARADPAWAEAANLHGKAAWRVAQGEMDLASRLLAQAVAAERVAADLENRAFRLRLDAAHRQAAVSVHTNLLHVAA